MITYLYHRIIFAALRNKIKNNPYIGKGQNDGSYLYTKGSYIINYRIIKEPDGQLCIEWVDHKRRLSGYEARIRRIKKSYFDFWHYQRWMVFFRVPTIFLLVILVLLSYFVIIEPQEARINRFRWLIAKAAGVNLQEVKYIGRGYIEISDQRERKDATRETIKHTFNPFRWFFFYDAGFVNRYRSGSGEYVKYPVVFNERGDVWIKKPEPWQPGWQHGKISDKTIEWDTPQGSAGVTEQDTTRDNRRLKLIDK